MKSFVKIELHKQKNSFITGVLIGIVVISLGYLVFYLIIFLTDFDAETYEWLWYGMWIVDSIIGGLLIRFICEKPNEPGHRDRPQGPGDHP